MDFDNLRELLAQMKGQDFTSLDTVDTLELRVCSYHPEIKFQCNVKFRNSNLLWGSAVDADPEVAAIRALHKAFRGEAAVKAEHEALFHLKKDQAQDALDDLLMIFDDRIGGSKIEFEPYRGWVIVVMPKTREDIDFLEKALSGQAEVRTPDHRIAPTRASNTGGSTKSASPKTPAAPKPPKEPKAPSENARAANLPKGFEGITLPDPGPEVSGMNKSALVKKFQEIRGKQPNNALDRTILAGLVQYMLDHGDPATNG